MKNILLILLFISSCAAHAASGYRIVHPDGSVEFTDQPRQGAEEIELRETPATHFEAVKPSRVIPEPVKKTKAAVEYSRLAITSPQADEILWTSEQDVNVSVELQPALEKGHRLRINLDGAEAASVEATTAYLTPVYRGSHTLGAEVVDENGKVVISSPVITFHLHQRSIQHPSPGAK